MIELTLERVKEKILKLPGETIKGFSATEFEDITAIILRDLGYEVDYQPGSLRFPDIIVNV